ECIAALVADERHEGDYGSVAWASRDGTRQVGRWGDDARRAPVVAAAPITPLVAALRVEPIPDVRFRRRVEGHVAVTSGGSACPGGRGGNGCCSPGQAGCPDGDNSDRCSRNIQD